MRHKPVDASTQASGKPARIIGDGLRRRRRLERGDEELGKAMTDDGRTMRKSVGAGSGPASSRKAGARVVRPRSPAGSCRTAAGEADAQSIQRKIGVDYVFGRVGFRPNVGIILLNHRNQMFLAGSGCAPHARQPQRGHHSGSETLRSRRCSARLREEVGLGSSTVRHPRAHARLSSSYGAGPLASGAETRGHYLRAEADLVPGCS